MITLKEDVWFHCTLWDWVVREGNCSECEHQGKPECPKPKELMAANDKGKD